MVNALISLIKSMDVFGMGSEPIAIALAGAATLFMMQKSIKEKDYYDAAIVFGINWGLMMAIGIAGNVAMLAIYWIIVFYLMFFNKKIVEKVSHTISK